MGKLRSESESLAVIGGTMKCEFCQGRGRGFDETRVVSWPCPECGGTGLQHCCEGLRADPVVDGDWVDNPTEADSFGRKR